MTRTMEARSRSIEQSRREVENIAWSASQQAEAVFQLASASLAGLVERVETDGTGPEQVERLRRMMIVQLESVSALQALTLVDESGYAVVDATPATPRVNLADRSYFQYHRDHPDRELHIGLVVRSRISGKWIIPLSRRVNHSDGSFAGTLTATVETSYFLEFYATFHIGRVGAVALWRDDGILLVRHSQVVPTTASNGSDSPAPIRYTFPAAASGTYELVSPIDGTTRILSYRRLAGFPLVVAMTLGKDEQLAAWRSDAAEHLVAAILVTLVLGFVGFRLMTQAQQTAQAERANALVVARSNDSLTRLSRHLVQARDRAEQASRAKSRFLAGMSHELRTPLNGILGYAQLLHIDGGLNPSQAVRVDAMLQAGKHLLEMITCVLDLSEIEADHVAVQAIGFALRPVAEACLDLIRPAAAAKRLALRLVVAAATPGQMIGDPVRLRQVLLNLLGNAAKFTSQGGITLQLRPMADGLLRIEVMDTGPGIPAEQRRRLFQDFERLDTAATRTAEGAGLGLALSARLAVLIGGRLGYEDNAGGGSVFWLELPVANGVTPRGATPGAASPGAASAEAAPPAEAAPSAEAALVLAAPGTALAAAGILPEAAPVAAAPAFGRRQAAPVAPAARALHVLVVDDVLMNRNIASAFLRAGGHTAQCAEEGAEAVAAVAGTDFDVVLMDVRMPGMDGLEATRRIRALAGARGHVPIVALTAQAFTDQVEACRVAGMDSHLAKPFDMDALLLAVARAAASRPAVGRAVAKTTGAGRGPTSSATHPRLPPLDRVLDRAVFERTAGFLTPEAVAASMRTIVALGDSVLRGLREPEARHHPDDALIEAAHTLAGSAGMFGFMRLAAAGRAFERAVQTGAAELPALTEDLHAAVEGTLQEIPRP